MKFNSYFKNEKLAKIIMSVFRRLREFEAKLIEDEKVT